MISFARTSRLMYRYIFLFIDYLRFYAFTILLLFLSAPPTAVFIFSVLQGNKYLSTLPYLLIRSFNDMVL